MFKNAISNLSIINNPYPFCRRPLVNITDTPQIESNLLKIRAKASLNSRLVPLPKSKNARSKHKQESCTIGYEGSEEGAKFKIGDTTSTKERRGRGGYTGWLVKVAVPWLSECQTRWKRTNRRLNREQKMGKGKSIGIQQDQSLNGLIYTPELHSTFDAWRIAFSDCTICVCTSGLMSTCASFPAAAL